MNKGPDRGYYPEPSKPLFISDTPGQEESTKKEFTVDGLTLNFGSGSQYLGAYLVPRYQLEAWLKPQVGAWTHRVIVLGKISQQHPQLTYAVLVMSLNSNGSTCKGLSLELAL